MANGIPLGCLIFAACALAGCSQPRAAPSVRSDLDATLVTLRAQEFVRPGEPVAALIGVRAPGWTGSEASVVGADGAVLGDATLEVLRLEPAASPGAWSGAWPRWTLSSAADGAEPGSTALALTPPLPEGTAAVEIGGARISLRDVADSAWPRSTSPRPIERVSVASDAEDPMRWWRLDLLGAPGSPASESMRRLAQQVRNEWAAALARARDADAARHDLLLASLGRTMQTETGACYPAWRTDAARSSHLLRELTAPDATALRIQQAIDAWLADDTDAIAWIIDDGAGARQTRIGVANLTDSPVAASASAAGRVEMISLPAHAVHEIEISAPIADETPIDVRVGHERIELRAATSPWRATPPGVRIGPFLPQWTLPTWLGESPVALDPLWATGALLQRGDGGAWELFVDCRTPVNDGGADLVTIVVGDPKSPAGVVTIRSTGEVQVRPASWSNEVSATVRRESGRWTALVTLPRSWTSESALLLGLERADARGVRSSWPRAMTPWQTTLPVLLIELDSWDEAPDR